MNALSYFRAQGKSAAARRLKESKERVPAKKSGPNTWECSVRDEPQKRHRPANREETP